MSPKKKSAGAQPAPKDDLIDALLDNEDSGPTTSTQPAVSITANSDSSIGDRPAHLAGMIRPKGDAALAKPRPVPPPPPAIDDVSALFDFQKQADVAAKGVGSSPGDAPTAKFDSSHKALERLIPSPEGLRSLSVVTPVEGTDVKTQQVAIDQPVVFERTATQAMLDKTVTNFKSSEDRPGTLTLAPREQTADVDPEKTVALELTPESAPELVPQLVPDSGPKTDSGESKSDRSTEKSSPRLQRLEQVLKRLRPDFKSDSKNETKASPALSPKVDRARLNPIAAKSIDPEIDEKTVANVTPGPSEPQSDLIPEKVVRPVWEDAKTELIIAQSRDNDPEEDREAEQFMPTEIRPNSPGARFREEARQVQPGAAVFSSAEAALRQSENLRVAQRRISDLEQELERVRRENDSLRSAGETLRRRMDELQAQAENAEMNAQETKRIAEEERKVLRGQITSRDREVSELKSRIDDAETRLEANFRKIRVRERDLEHRIEIIKAESQSIAASKDRMILELKRQIDQISSELNHSKAQVQETFGQFKEKQETSRRAVRALRIALAVLEGEDNSGSRKAE